MHNNTTEGKHETYGYVKHLELYETAYFDPRLQEATKSMFALLIRHTRENGISKHFSIQKISEKKGVSRQAVQNQVKKLIKFGYIKAEGKVGYRNHYTLLFDNLAPATQLDCTSIHATQSSCTKKIRENNERKKEKEALSRKSFLDMVKEENKTHSFQNDFGNLSETIIEDQAIACWEHCSSLLDLRVTY